MTREYAKLSFRAGILAGCIDRLTQDTEARAFMAPRRWEITEELIEEMKRRAIARGVKPQALDVMEALAGVLSSNPELVDEAMARQALHDTFRRMDD